MGLDEKKAQHAGFSFDIHVSLISIEVTTESAHNLPLAARRIRRQMRTSDSILLLGRSCTLVLPATSFSGAQAVATRVSQFLVNVPYEMHVYHGATALLILQHLCEAGATTIAPAEDVELSMPTMVYTAQSEEKDAPKTALPYLAFLTNYPAPHLLHLFPYELACRYQCVPVGAERKMLTLATCHWLNCEIIAQIRTVTRRGIFQVRCETTMVNEILRYWQRLQDTPDHVCSEPVLDEIYSSSR